MIRRKKSWAEARREEEEDLTSARGSYKSANSGQAKLEF
jgi:hypothetical protein